MVVFHILEYCLSHKKAYAHKLVLGEWLCVSILMMYFQEPKIPWITLFYSIYQYLVYRLIKNQERV